MNEIVENSSQLIASPDEAIEFLHDAYRHKETCHKRQKSAVRKAHLARIEAEKTLREAEYYAEKIVGLIRKNGFQLESRDPGFFVLVDGCEHLLLFNFLIAGCFSLFITFNRQTHHHHGRVSELGYHYCPTLSRSFYSAVTRGYRSNGWNALPPRSRMILGLQMLGTLPEER
jgi:hypothetical protein